MNRKVSAISFDFWNTLFRDLQGPIYQVKRLQIFLETVNRYHPCTEIDARAAFSYVARESRRIWREEYRTPTSRERITMVLNHLKIEIPEEALAELSRIIAELVLEYPPTLIEGVPEVLAKFAPRYPLGIISDTGYAPGKVLREVLRRNNILHYFQTLTFSDEIGNAKPHPLVFRQTARGLGIPVAELLHVGDLEHTDVYGAKALGAWAVLFGNVLEGNESIADFSVQTYLQFTGVVERLEIKLQEALD